MEGGGGGMEIEWEDKGLDQLELEVRDSGGK